MFRVFLFLVSLLLIVLGAFGIVEAGQPARPRPFTVAVPMRDGKHLAADIFLPAAKGRFPTILIFTPYNRKTLGAAVPAVELRSDLIDRDHYAFVIADWRGFFGSRDAAVKRRSPFATVGTDGYDLVEWIARQKWSDGKVGMWGASALGAAQYRTAIEKPPHLVCIVPVVIRFGVAYEHRYYGGVLKRSNLIAREQAGFKGSAETFIAHPVRDRWWEYIEAASHWRLKDLDLPVFTIGGWYDTETDATIDTFQKIRAKAGPRARRNVKMLIGPWNHVDAAAGKRIVGELEFPEAERVSEKEAHRFFDYWLRGKTDNGWADEPAVRWFQMGSRQWEHADSWPPAETQDRVWYLRSGGVLAPEPEDGECEPDTFRYDPNDPSPTVGGMNLYIFWKKDAQEITSGPKDQRAKVESRNDHVAYTSEALAEDVVLRGNARVRLHVSSNCVDTDFMVRLCDVYPDGRSMLVTDGARRMRFRKSFEEPELMEPGKVYEVTVTLAVTAHTFRKGHQIRILVSSSNYPRFDVNPNNGEHFLTDRAKARVAENRIYHDATHVSALFLPVAARDR
ncbi:MAG: CocE/NonD family hydrolase [Planctomycetes bacterium]|nr:CocE/NonD family hydrolase [Planctomycetota bacterium]